MSVHTCVVGTESIARVIVYMLSHVHTPQARQTTLHPKNDKLIHYFRLVAKSDFIFFFFFAFINNFSFNLHEPWWVSEQACVFTTCLNMCCLTRAMQRQNEIRCDLRFRKCKYDQKVYRRNSSFFPFFICLFNRYFVTYCSSRHCIEFSSNTNKTAEIAYLTNIKKMMNIAMVRKGSGTEAH